MKHRDARPRLDAKTHRVKDGETNSFPSDHHPNNHQWRPWFSLLIEDHLIMTGTRYSLIIEPMFWLQGTYSLLEFRVDCFELLLCKYPPVFSHPFIGYLLLAVHFMLSCVCCEAGLAWAAPLQLVTLQIWFPEATLTRCLTVWNYQVTSIGLDIGITFYFTLTSSSSLFTLVETRVK